MAELAVAERNELTAGDEEQLVTMMVDGQMFGIPILRVQDIVEPQQITPVPLAPSAIAGVLNLRGRIVTVIDLRECLGAPTVDDAERLMSVTVEHKGDLFTLLVDSIGDVRSLPRAAFDKPPVTLDQRMRRLCTGVFRLEGQLLAVLDVEKVLDDEFISAMPTRTRQRLALGRRKDGRAKSAQAEGAARKSAPANDSDDEDGHAAASAKPAAKSGTPKQAAEPALFERMGGEAAIDGAVELFLEKAGAHEQLAPVIGDASASGPVAKALLAQALGGPQSYDARTIKKAVKSLETAHGFDHGHVIAAAAMLSDVLAQMGLPDDLIEAVMTAVEELREEAMGG